MHGKLDPAIVYSALSQFIYLVKFFVWEMGYMRSIDIIVDRVRLPRARLAAAPPLAATEPAARRLTPLPLPP